MRPEDLYFNPYNPTRITRNRLPHWQQDSVTYFITFRQNDSLPSRVQDRMRAVYDEWMAAHPFPWSDYVREEYKQRFARWEQRVTDRGYGSCVFQDRGCRQIMASCLMHDNGVKYNHLAWIIMPNHVHLLTHLPVGESLGNALQTWKSVSAHEVNAWIEKKGELWQKAYYDRILRNWLHFQRCVRYIRENPSKAGLKRGEFLAYEGELASTVD